MSKIKIFKPRLDATLAAESANAADRTVQLQWYSGAAVRRYSFLRGEYTLQFSMDPAHVRLGALNSGRAPILESHSDWSTNDVLGVVEKGWLEDGKGRARARFAKNDEAADRVWNKIEQKILRNVSMGVTIHKLKETSKEDDQIKSYLAIDWEPLEISVCAVGADRGAQMLSAEQPAEVEVELLAATAATNQGAIIMDEVKTNETQTAAVNPDADAERIRGVAAACNLRPYGETLIKAGVSLSEARRLLIDKMASNQAPFEIRGVHADVTRDGYTDLRDGMVEALMVRANAAKATDRARPWIERRLSDFAREILRAHGLEHWGGDSRVVTLALQSTSDFPGLLGDFASKLLMASYAAVPSALRTIARRSSAADFKTQYRLRRGEFPALEEVKEHGEIRHGNLLEAKESYSVKTFGKIVGLTRQAIINDNLAAFQDLTGAAGQAAADFEANYLVSLLAGPAGVGPNLDDGKAVFHVDHHNLAGTPAAIDLTSVSAGRVAMRSQKSLDNLTLVDAAPAFLVTGAAKQTIAEQFVATLSPATISNANPLAGQLQVIIEPRLDSAVSATAWYLAADPARVPSIEYAYLEGEPGPQTVTRVGFDVLGVEIRITEDFGAGFLDFRGIYKNPGA